MYQLSVLIHIVSAIVWVGGMLFLALVVVPVARQLPAAERGALIGAFGRRFRLVGWTCIVLLVTTGIINAGFRGATWGSVASGAFFESPFGRLLTAKLALMAVMLALSIVHDFVIGPASTRVLARSDLAAQRAGGALRRRASWMARANAILALLVIALAVALVRGLPW